MGSRSALIVPPKAGNRGHRDPLEGSGASPVQSHWRETLEETLSSTNTYTKQQWIAQQARERSFLDLRIKGGVVRRMYARSRQSFLSEPVR